MKVFSKVVCVCVAMSMATAVFAATEKDPANHDENGKFVRGPYATNGFGANWFAGAAGGVNIFMNGVNGYGGRAAAALDVYAGKWFIPDLGLRLAYSGLAGQMNGAEYAGADEKLVEKFQFWYIHGDVMWNISNTIGGYREARFWNVVPYVHFGAMRLFDHTNAAYDPSDPTERLHHYDNEIAFGVGLYNTLRFTKRIFGTIDVRETMLPSRFHAYDDGGITSNLSVSLGIGVNIGKVGWDRAENAEDSKAALAEAAAALAAAQALASSLEDDNKALAQEKDEVVKVKDQLQKDFDALKNAPAIVIENTDTVYVKLSLGIAPLTLFFEKNSAVLSQTELKHLAYYVENVIEKDADRVFYFTGTADSSTGNDAINTRLCKARVDNTIKVLRDKYGISEDRLKFKGIVISDESSDPRLNRSVKIEH